MNKLPATGPFVDRITRIFRDHPYDDTSAIVLMDYANSAIAANHNDAAAESAAKLLLAKYEHAPCDSRAVSDCVRCNAVYLAKQAITGSSTPQPAAVQDGEWAEQARQMIVELRDYVVNERDAQVLPRKRASYQRELDEIDALLAAPPQQEPGATCPHIVQSKEGTAYCRLAESAGASGGGEAVAWQTRYPGEHWVECNKHWHDVVAAERPNDARALYDRATPTSPAAVDKRHVGDSKFESWYAGYCRTDWPDGTKQIARDAYAAGMGDDTQQPAAPQPQDSMQVIECGGCAPPVIATPAHGDGEGELPGMWERADLVGGATDHE